MSRQRAMPVIHVDRPREFSVGWAAFPCRFGRRNLVHGSVSRPLSTTPQLYHADLPRRLRDLQLNDPFNENLHYRVLIGLGLYGDWSGALMLVLVERMKTWQKILAAAFILVAIDTLWLGLIGSTYSAVVEKIQGGRGLRARLWLGAIVYIALAFLLLKERSAWDAFSTGVASYAVYDFTVATLFIDYPVWLGVADSLWGGVLFLTTNAVLKKLGGFY
jgi:hypothetical protein